MPARKTPAKKAAKKAAKKSPAKKRAKKAPANRLSKGEPLAEICRSNHMPARQKVYEWREKDEAIAGLIARARDEGYDAIAHRLRETARGNGESSKDVQRDKLIIETDLKLLSKWSPDKYGDKMQAKIEHAGDITVTIGGNVD